MSVPASSFLLSLTAVNFSYLLQTPFLCNQTSVGNVSGDNFVYDGEGNPIDGVYATFSYEEIGPATFGWSFFLRDYSGSYMHSASQEWPTTDNIPDTGWDSIDEFYFTLTLPPTPTPTPTPEPTATPTSTPLPTATPVPGTDPYAVHGGLAEYLRKRNVLELF